MTNRRELADRLEAAECGSRELDYALKAWLETFDDYWAIRVAADWTTSLDAALALAERVLPGWICGIDTDGNASVWDGKYILTTRSAFVMRHPALALCAAILRARLDDEGKGLPKTPERPVA